MKITAKNILDLLLTKHSRDFVCVPECKTGETGRHRSIDLWCMAKSWAKPRTIGYEIKVARSDFVRDNKWRRYLDYSSEFYFAASPGIIDPSELPDEAGLLVCSKNAKMLYTKKKAPERSVEIPESIFRYILMWRTEVCEERRSPSQVAYWRDWLEEKAEKRDLGYSVSRAVRQHVQRVDLENSVLKRENETLQETRSILKKLGFRVGEMAWNGEGKVRQRIQEINTGVSLNLLNSIDTSINALKKTREALS
ncbi:MAG TPA: DNA repair protein MmcB-related protein [Nitrospirae bacterium]|nr:DNA repair protein MmcB-related protein [Nitrospirota bacterium]